MRWPYAADLYKEIPLIDKGATDFEATPVTPVAGDVKVSGDRVISANPSIKTIAFTSGGTEAMRPGDTLTGATSGATCVLIRQRIVSGSYAGGDAAGFLFVKSDSGTFQSENLNNTTTGTNNVATIGGALSTLPFQHVGGGVYGFAVPGSQIVMQVGHLIVKDQDVSPKAFEDVALDIETEDHPLAQHPNGCKYAGTAASIAAGYLRATAGTDGVDYPAAAHETIIGPVDGSAPGGFLLYIQSAATGQGQAIPLAYFDYTGGAGEKEYGFLGTLPYVPTGTVTYKVYEASKAPAHVVAALAAVNTAIAAAVFARAFSSAYGSLTFDQVCKVMVAALAAKLSGAATTTITIRNLADNADVIVATVDADGNRTAVTLTP